MGQVANLPGFFGGFNSRNPVDPNRSVAREHSLYTWKNSSMTNREKVSLDDKRNKRLPSMVAIDGPAASGKSTLAEKLAEELGYLYFDTGVMYRAATYAALLKLGTVNDERAVTRLTESLVIDVLPPSKMDGRKYDVLLDGKDITWPIHSREVEMDVSQVSAYQGVRAALTEQQRRIGQRGDVVMVGRDIGTVVMPDAPLKIYLVASVEERARRRYEEKKQRGDPADYDEILIMMKRRDKIDSTREIAPLRPAEDAIVIDSDNLNAEQILQMVIDILVKKSNESDC